MRDQGRLLEPHRGLLDRRSDACPIGYVIIDIYSRYLPGWLLADRKSSTLAEQLLADICFKQNIGCGQLSIHADRGSSMASKPVALLLSDLGVTKSHSRPHVSNDNPCSEAPFNTRKYRPDFPRRFGSIEHARSHTDAFIGWYNGRHQGIGLVTPADVHYGRAPAHHRGTRRDPRRGLRDQLRTVRQPTTATTQDR